MGWYTPRESHRIGAERRLLRVNGVWCGRVVVLQVLKLCHSVFTHLDNVTARLRLVVPVYLAPSANSAPKNAQRVGHPVNLLEVEGVAGLAPALHVTRHVHLPF